MQHASEHSLAGTASRAACALLLLGSLAHAQRSEAEIKTDLAFARGLAAQWQYVDLAEEVIRDLEKGGGLSREAKQELGLAKCEIYAEGAKREGDVELRNELYLKAVDAYSDYIEKNPLSEVISQAERGYVDICNLYGRSLERRHRDALGEEAQMLKSQVTDVLEGALRYTGELTDSLHGDGDDWPLAQKLEWARVMFNRSQMYHTLGRISEEGAFFYSQAEKTLEDLALAMGETTPQGLFGYLELADVYLSQNRVRDAADFSEFVVNTVLPLDAKVRRDGGWDELTAEQRGKRWLFVERGTRPLVEAYLEAGYPEDASTWALHFYNSWKREGFTMSPSGYLSLISVARSLLDGGGFVGGNLTAGNLKWYETAEEMEDDGVSRRDRRSALDLSLSIAQTVNRENKGNTLQVYAQKMIFDVINRPGVPVSPDVLFEAAQGEYYNKNYTSALGAFRRVLRALDGQDEATRAEYGARVMYHIAESLRKQDRTLEAAVAYREGATLWRGDPEYDEKNAKGYYGTTGELRSKAPGTPQFDEMRRDSENLLTQVSEDTDDIVFRQAKRIYDRDDFDEARNKFADVKLGSAIKEKAIAYSALCLYKLKDYDAAAQEFSEYLTVFVSDPTHAVTSRQAVATRAEARSMATYYLGTIAYQKANQGTGSYDAVIDRLATFHEEFEDQTSYAPNALYMVLMAHLAKGDFESVKSTHDIMVELFRSNSRTGTGALKIYKVLLLLQKEQREQGDEAGALDTLEKLASYMKLSNDLAASPSFGNLRNESLHWQELGQYEEAERVLRSILSSFAQDPEQAETLVKHVQPDLGIVLLAQHRAQDAFDLLAPLVPDPDGDTLPPSSTVVSAYCRSIAGWVESEDEWRTITEVPGVGGAENLNLACKYWVKLTRALERESKWETPWYERKFETAYAYYQWGVIDTEKMSAARSQIATLRQELGEDLAEMEDKSLRKRFLWLWSKVRQAG